MKNNLDKLICEEVYNFMKDKTDEIELPGSFNIPPSWDYNEMFCYKDANDFLNHVKNNVNDALKCLYYIIPKCMNKKYHSFLKTKLVKNLYELNGTYFDIEIYCNNNLGYCYKYNIVNIELSNKLKENNNVYIIVENKSEKSFPFSNPWRNQKYLIISCPIINTMTMNNGTLLYNIKFNNEYYQLSDYENPNKLNINYNNVFYNYIKVLKYHNSNDGNEILNETSYNAFYTYQDALKNIKIKYLDELKMASLKIESLRYSLIALEEHLEIDKAINTDNYYDV